MIFALGSTIIVKSNGVVFVVKKIFKVVKSNRVYFILLLGLGK